MMVPVGIFFPLFNLTLLQRVNGDGAKPLATKSNCWMGLSIVETTANALTTMTTPEDWHANVTQDIRHTKYTLVWGIYQYDLSCCIFFGNF